MQNLDPETIKLIEWMTGPAPSHPKFVGEAIDPTRIDALALGDLWPYAHEVELWDNARPISGLAANTARAILALSREREPAFRGHACQQCLDLYSRDIEEKSPDGSGYAVDFMWDRASFVLRRCIDFSFDGLGPAARRFLAVATWNVRPHLALALARLVDEATMADIRSKFSLEFASSPILLDEIGTLAELDIAAHIAAADTIGIGRRETASTIDGSYYRLAEAMPYTVAAGAGLREAAAHLRRLHDDELPYHADKAFTLDDSGVLGRFARVALERDETWLPPVLDELFRKVSLAPTAAKTVPSQSLSIALGHAIEAFPTPEAVASLRSVLRDIRHEGVKKKLQRNLRGAERGLATRPEVALRLPLEPTVSKAQLTTMARCLEASLALGLTMDYEDWCSRLATHPQIKSLTGALVWQLSTPEGGNISVLPVLGQADVLFQDVLGASVTAAIGQRLTLWHPAAVTQDERAAWRRRLTDLRLKQPFRQVFREHYLLEADEQSSTETQIFADHVVSITPFLGLARRESWQPGYERLTRSFGPWTADFHLADSVYPGLSGATVTGKLGISALHGGKLQPARLGNLPAATLSEILRAADLLVSVGGFAIATEEMHQHRGRRLRTLAQSSLSAMMEMRKQALVHALDGLDGVTDLRFEGHYLRLGPYAIHLSTGRVTLNGEPLTIDLPQNPSLSAVPWLPYDEKLLELICYTAIEIADRLKLPFLTPTQSSPAAST